jgi:hypothetical protein
VKSWIKFNDSGKVTAVYFEWDGKDAKSVKKSLTSSIPELPFPEVCQMAKIHAKTSDNRSLIRTGNGGTGIAGPRLLNNHSQESQ